jgi:hypothetical protein
MTTPELVSGILSIVVNVFMPWLIAFVATSQKRWINFAIAYASSAVVGVLTAWVGGQFTHAVWPSILVGITAAQAAYHTFWANKLPVNSLVQPTEPVVNTDGQVQ